MKKLKKLTFYKTIWFWLTICLLVYILRQSKVTVVKMFIDIASYVYQQVISEPIAFLAFLISIITVYIERINVLKTDRRAKLSISYKKEEMSEVKAEFNGEKKEIEVPKLRIYENSGTIKSTYIFTPYIKNNDVKNDTIDDNYFHLMQFISILMKIVIFSIQPGYIIIIVLLPDRSFRIIQMKINLILFFVYSKV